MKERPEPSLSVVVPAHRAGEPLRQCLASLARTSPSRDEIIVVADGPAEGVGRLAEEFGFRLIRNPVAGGPARARNIGAREARGDLLFFVDSDVAIAPDTIARVKDEFVRDPGLSAVFGSYDDGPAAANFLSQYRNLFHHYVHQTSSEDASTFWGACGVVRREVFAGLGGFNEAYRRPCIEDIEFGYRMKRAGHRIRLVKTLQCKHLKRWNALSLLKSDIFDRALPWTELILRDRSLINDLNLKHSNRLSTVLVFAFVVLLFLFAVFLRPAILWAAAALFAASFALNFRLYRFLFHRRGFWFMMMAVPWHCIYYACCGAAFAVGLVRTVLVKSPAMPGK